MQLKIVQKFVRQKKGMEMLEEIHKSTITVGDSNTFLSVVDRSNGKKISSCPKLYYQTI